MSEYIITINDEPEEDGCYRLTKPAKPIVRCRDCVHMLSIDLSDYYGNPEPKLEVCKRVRGVPLDAEPDGYCAWAERREQ